jgi:hypothetical protein
MFSIYTFADVVIWLFINFGMPFFVFFLVYTIAMRDRDKKLKIREITKGLFKKIF